MMRKNVVAVVAALALFSALAACESDRTEPRPTTTVTTTKAADISVHESGPESPIAYGLQVPKGATQLGPLVRYRSAALIAAYRPELDAITAQEDAERRQLEADALKEGKTLPTPAPTPLTRPKDDTFNLLEDPPKPDSTVSLMRIDGNISDVVTRMISQISVVLPDADIDTKDLSSYCPSTNSRYTGCRLDVRGLTAGDRDVRVSLTVDPGNIETRLSGPGAQTNPVMTLSVSYVGEVRKGQLGRETDGIDNLPNEDLTAPPSDLIWPKMDKDSDSSVALINGTWKAPVGASILLSGDRPDFVALNTIKGSQSDLIAEEYARAVGAKGQFSIDIVEDLNEISATYTATRKDGVIAFGTYVLSARGNYAMLFYLPKPTV